MGVHGPFVLVHGPLLGILLHLFCKFPVLVPGILHHPVQPLFLLPIRLQLLLLLLLVCQLLLSPTLSPSQELEYHRDDPWGIPLLEDKNIVE